MSQQNRVIYLLLQKHITVLCIAEIDRFLLFKINESISLLTQVCF